MESRYTYMTQSVYQDIDGDFFPDPTTLNYNNLIAKNIKTIELTEITCEKFWIILPTLYGNYELDDILLSINRIPHRNMLRPGDIIFAPTLKDIRESFSDN